MELDNPRPWGVPQRELSRIWRTQYARLWSVTRSSAAASLDLHA